MAVVLQPNCAMAVVAGLATAKVTVASAVPAIAQHQRPLCFFSGQIRPDLLQLLKLNGNCFVKKRAHNVDGKLHAHVTANVACKTGLREVGHALSQTGCSCMYLSQPLLFFICQEHLSLQISLKTTEHRVGMYTRGC